MMKTIGIIGGGVAGLAAGGFLSRMGMRVLLFEANNKIGGCCSTTNVDGYTFNDGALHLAFPHILDHVFEKLGSVRSSVLPLRRITACQETIVPDGSRVWIENGKVFLSKGTNGSRDHAIEVKLTKLITKWGTLYQLFRDDLLVRELSLGRVMRKGWRYIHLLRGRVSSEIERLFDDEAVRAAMSGTLLFAGVAPQTMPTVMILGLVSMLCDGLYLPEGGMGRIPDVLSTAMTNHGGEIYLGSETERIIVRNGRVVALIVDGHGEVEVDAVISTVSGMLTYGSLLEREDVSRVIGRKVKNAPLSHRAFAVQLGLSNTIHSTSHLNCELPFMREQHEVFVPFEGKVRWQVYSVPTVTMPELGPPGGSILEMYPPVNQHMDVEDWSERNRSAVAEAAIHSLSKRHKLDIVVRRILSPKDFQNQMHLYKGAVYGLSPMASPAAYFPHRTPICGLFHAGQTTFPGFGVASAAMSGILAAEALVNTGIN